MHEENEWDHKISAEVMEGPADCIRMSEVRAVLKKMKRHKTSNAGGILDKDLRTYNFNKYLQFLVKVNIYQINQ